MLLRPNKFGKYFVKQSLNLKKNFFKPESHGILMY